MVSEMKRAVCNELFGEISFEESCDLLATQGFHGVELAPFTLFDKDNRIGPQTQARVKRTLQNTGLEYAGIHWLLAQPEGLHITTPDAAKRKKTREHIMHLLDVSGELGGGGLILGSPKQRGAEGIDTERAIGYLKEELDIIGNHAQRCGSKLLMESLPSAHTDVINTLEEVQKLLLVLDNPGLSGMFDFHNCVDEKLEWAELIHRYAPIIEHVHLNTWEGEYPGPEQSGEYVDSFRALSEIYYEGWISLEVFTVYPQPQTLLQQTTAFLDRVMS